MPLTSFGRRAAQEKAVHESNVRRVLEIAGSWGLPEGDGSDLPEELHLHAVAARDGQPRGVADVWRQGMRTS